MDEETRRLRRISRELEPLAYMYERFNVQMFEVCYDLYYEYKRLYELTVKRLERRSA